MKLKTSLWIVWGITLLFEANAQILTGPVVGGQATRANYSPQYDGVDFYQDFSLNYLGGWSYAYEVSDRVAFYSELLYSRKGKIQRYNSTSTRILKHQAYAHFLEAPLMLRITGPLGRSKNRWFLNVGPQISYWLGSQGNLSAYEFFGSTETTTIDYKVDFSRGEPSDGTLVVSDANRLQFGLAFGGGISIPVNRQGHQIAVNLRYITGTTHMGGNESVEIGTSAIEEYLGFGYNALQISTAYVVPINVFGMRRGKSSRKVKHKK